MEANSVAAVDFGSELTEQAAVSTLDGRNISEAADALPQLAASLDLLAGFLGKAGHWHDAHAAAEEAVGIYRRITAVEPAGFRAELARSIGNLAVALGEIGRVDEAIDLAQESVTLSRRLAGREQSQEAQPQKS
ncbi:tetratricopeptide repeat protein [Nocardia sp.]|uniref:tetratricopeptide repeat protein n=1 Tax=Nocardia sp. TaxID=1821 RepID=UPI003454ABB5